MLATPRFLTLPPDECQKILERNHVGRLAFLRDNAVDIQPIGYVADDRWLFMRSAPGEKLLAVQRNPFVAFEVDEVEGPFDWASVVVRGTIYLLDETGDAVHREQFARALRAIREFMPRALTPEDPVPARQVIYGLHVNQMTGRTATSATPEEVPRRPAQRPASAPLTRADPEDYS